MKPVIAAVCLAIAAGAVASADTLVLTNGRRIQGELLGVYGREIEFEERNGGARRVVRVPRNEIARIEFVDEAPFAREPAQPAGPVPPGMRERNIHVNPQEAWTDTGINVRAGQQVYFQSSGRVQWAPDRRDGPAGRRNSPNTTERPLRERPSGALIGRVGANDVLFIGGDLGPLRMRGNGRLYLGVNDDVLDDNSGAFTVIVSY